MVNLGIIGYSDQNGHPYSFSSIINGYDRNEYKKTEWTGILNYLERRGSAEIATLNAKVTHVWTQSQKYSEEIARCSLIDNIAENYTDLIGNVDAVIIARDDFESHKAFAEPFLSQNIPVLIDKPLTLSLNELSWFEQYHAKGLLMSCSALRFCGELDDVRNHIEDLGQIRLIRAAVINGWEKYGIHMLDATLGIYPKKTVSIKVVQHDKHDTYFVTFEDGLILQIDTLGPDVFSFSYEIFGTKKTLKTEIRDNFTSFKRMLERFIFQVNSKTPQLSFRETSISIKTLIAGKEAKDTGKEVTIC